MEILEMRAELDGLTLADIHGKNTLRIPNKDILREERLLSRFDRINLELAGNAQLNIIEGPSPSYCASSSSKTEIGMNLGRNHDFKPQLTDAQIEMIDLFSLAHECGHMAQFTHQLTRYMASSKRSREANADYFAGIWLGVYFKEGLPLFLQTLGEYAFALKGGGEGIDNYPFDFQREMLIKIGSSNADFTSINPTAPTSLNEFTFNAPTINDIWDASNATLSDLDTEAT